MKAEGAEQQATELERLIRKSQSEMQAKRERRSELAKKVIQMRDMYEDNLSPAELRKLLHDARRRFKEEERKRVKAESSLRAVRESPTG